MKETLKGREGGGGKCFLIETRDQEDSVKLPDKQYATVHTQSLAEIGNYICSFLERQGDDDLQDGKVGYSEKMLSINSAYLLYLSCSKRLSFRNGDLSASVSVQNRNVNFPCTYVVVTNKNVLPDSVVFLSYTVKY